MKKIILSAVLVAFVMTPAALMAMSHGKDAHGDHGSQSGHEMKKDHDDHGKKGHSTMDHSSKESMHKGMDHGKMDHDSMDHGSMSSHGDMEMLGSEVVEGVKARVHIKDVSEAMAKMGMDHTHHLMVSFVKDVNGGTGTPIEKGTVAVKVINPDESEAKPVKMMGMEGAFGADLVMKQKGMYHFYIGTKLEDGTKRKYHFHAEVE